MKWIIPKAEVTKPKNASRDLTGIVYWKNPVVEADSLLDKYKVSVAIGAQFIARINQPQSPDKSASCKESTGITGFRLDRNSCLILPLLHLKNHLAFYVFYQHQTISHLSSPPPGLIQPDAQPVLGLQYGI
jgi:hypothetical protein